MKATQQRDDLLKTAAACDRLAEICRNPENTEAWAKSYAVAFQEVAHAVSDVPPMAEHADAARDAMAEHAQRRRGDAPAPA